jgi:hypothetical protein
MISSKNFKFLIYFEEQKHTKKMQRSAKPNGVKRQQTNTRAAATDGRKVNGGLSELLPLWWFEGSGAHVLIDRFFLPSR